MVLPVGAGRDENMAGKDTATGKDSGKRYGLDNYGGKRYGGERIMAGKDIQPRTRAWQRRMP